MRWNGSSELVIGGFAGSFRGGDGCGKGDGGVWEACGATVKEVVGEVGLAVMIREVMGMELWKCSVASEGHHDLLGII